jgi:hypothetical protein
VPNKDKERVHGYYLRDDGELMIELRPGQFVSETAAHLGFVHPNVLADIGRIKGRLQRPPPRQLRQPEAAAVKERSTTTSSRSPNGDG